MNTIWFTADSHYYHANIVRYTNRPWQKPEDLDSDGQWKNKQIGRVRALEMTEDLIKWHNELVKPEDTVYHLGDFTFGGAQDAIKLLRRLNGNYKFIWGNHDKALRDARSPIECSSDLSFRVEFLAHHAEVEIEGQEITLNHYAMKVWNKSHRGAWSLYGHSHGTLPDDPNSMSFDGVDCHNYRPISWSKVKEIMSKKTFKPIDHHGKLKPADSVPENALQI